MPAFYRMPVVYCIAGVAAIAWLGARSVREFRSAPTHDRPAIENVKPPPIAAAPPAAAPEPPTDAILRNAEGLRRKVVVKELGVSLQSDPNFGKINGAALDYFSINFLYADPPKNSPEMIQVGDEQPRGWIPLAAVFEWDTRLMACPTPRGGRPRLVLFREEECATAVIQRVKCPRHPDHCPVEGEEPEESATNAAALATPMLGLPILKTKHVRSPRGEDVSLFEVASPVTDRPPPARPDEPPPDYKPLLNQVYVALVIDTTASMQAVIDACREFASNLVSHAKQRNGDVSLHLALVAYRDEAPSFLYKTRIVTSFTGPGGFREALERIEAAPRGDGSVPESVLAGLATALPRQDPKDREFHLNWPTGRAGELATKLLVLIGDAPDHAGAIGPVRAIAQHARDSGITVATVRIDRSGILSKQESARYHEQWRTLAESSFRPRDRTRGFAAPIDPLTFSLGADEALASRLQSLIDDRIEHARDLAAMAAAEAEGKLMDYVNSKGLSMAQVAPVLMDLHRGEARPRARPDPRLNGQKAPSVRRGWIAHKLDGKELVTLSLLMNRAELDVLIGELEAFRRASQSAEVNLGDLLTVGNAAVTGDTAFLAKDRAGLTFADHLRRRQGLPPARADSLLRRTQADLLQGDDVFRRALDLRLSAGLAQLIRRRNQADWDDPRRLVDGMALVPYAALDY